jgi:hypothetical protein
MVLTRIMPLQATMHMAFLTSTSPKESSKTTRTKALDGIPSYPHTGTLTTTRPKPSQPIMQSMYLSSVNANSPDIPNSQHRDPVDWLAFNGHWGDKQYPDNDPDQFCFLGIDALCKYTNGPTGPLSSSCRGRRSVLMVRRLVLFGMFWCRGIWMVESLET